MNIKHTPGPWVSHKAPSVRGGHGFVIQNAAHRGIMVASLFPGSSTDRIESVAEANARLIAEAPAMLEALRDVVSGRWGYLIDGDGSGHLRAILARIDGEDR